MSPPLLAGEVQEGEAPPDGSGDGEAGRSPPSSLPPQAGEDKWRTGGRKGRPYGIDSLTARAVSHPVPRA